MWRQRFALMRWLTLTLLCAANLDTPGGSFFGTSQAEECARPFACQEGTSIFPDFGEGIRTVSENRYALHGGPASTTRVSRNPGTGPMSSTSAFGQDPLGCFPTAGFGKTLGGQIAVDIAPSRDNTQRLSAKSPLYHKRATGKLFGRALRFVRLPMGDPGGHDNNHGPRQESPLRKT